MKQLLFIFSVALASCGTTDQFMSSYNTSGRQYGNQMIAQSGMNAMTRAKAGTVISNQPGLPTGGTMCPGSSSGNPILKPSSTPITPNQFNGINILNQIGRQVSRQGRTSQRKIVKIN